MRIMVITKMGKLKKQFGARLRQLRLQSGRTQKNLADRIGITYEEVSNIERGLHGPRFDTLEKLGKIFKLPVMALFDFR